MPHFVAKFTNSAHEAEMLENSVLRPKSFFLSACGPPPSTKWVEYNILEEKSTYTYVIQIGSSII